MTSLVVAGLLACLALGGRAVARRGRRPSGPPRRRAALLAVIALLLGQAVLGAPVAHAQVCEKEAPNPERPGAGMVGALDPAPLGAGQPGSAYDEVGYAGLVWHTYDLGCVAGAASNPNAVIDTWAGNELFNVGKNLVGATNGLHYMLLSGDLMKPLDDLVMTGTIALYNSVYAPWFGLVALLLAVVLFRHIWRGDLATISKRGMWALGGIWLASATYLTPLIYTHALDEVLITGTSQAQAGFLKEVGIDERNALPTVLHDQVVYRNWLRGEFGSPDAPQAQQHGRDLLRAQAWTKQEVAEGKDAGSADPKKNAFKSIANQATLGSTYGYLKGTDGSRLGAGVLGALQGVAYALFQLLAKAAILLAQVLLRVLILAGPVIGLVAMLYHDVLRAVGRAIGAALLNVIVLAALAGMHTLMLTWIFNPGRGFSLLTQMLLAGLITVVFFIIGKPVRRLWQMVELGVGAVGSAVPSAGPGLLGRLRRRRATGPTPQDEFWEQVREMDLDEEIRPAKARRRARPEAAGPVVAHAERVGAATAIGGAAGVAGAVAGAIAGAARRPDGQPALTAGPSATVASVAGRGPGRAAGELPAARSRLVDTSPVVDRSWDHHGEDAVVIPSRINGSHRQSAGVGPAVPEPRRADVEVVAGRPVWVVYRPSRGMEFRDGWVR
ncbi:hypothetical protein LX15_003392 [Streptoalloteichus tenebrarius]|uniref:Integral membrane protein n=1 Tax=Streptoalloteichus tenebrarius (strain ATCC 17920 / DSM 40477 / JCM 4838 / CBS 697.72 / NBRC 16177 / NCIMB 11028 / NRRL B-12390 / A12253. 1 / ISP 5477) TaxID=1933 RepID=A0ABT1HW10_STRSD|nr:hypothetical protein [Streptoalloteichus tenebrarius]MCP2259686.1 hypothetical protein [Streptoalloteichus tenebrarius]BFF00663.1 hypothetical protein GCM10020241_23380 [Streptoalloteichus tenebrarius]